MAQDPFKQTIIITVKQSSYKKVGDYNVSLNLWLQTKFLSVKHSLYDLQQATFNFFVPICNREPQHHTSLPQRGARSIQTVNLWATL